MRERVEVLRQARMKHQEQIVAQKLEEVWKRDSQELRELKSKQVNLETAKAWGDQISIRQQTEEEDRMIEQQMVENMKREVQLAAEKDEQKQSEEKNRMKSLTEIWQEQIESLRKHEDQMKALQQQEREILSQLDSLAKMEDQRKKMEAMESKKELGKTLLNQHAAHIRRRNRQVQESLEFDRNLLESITKMEEESLQKQQEDRQRQKTVAVQIRETMKERLRKEKEREKEVDRLDREEAKLYWDKREYEWRAEEDARKHLVEEVIGDLKAQLREKVAANRRAQQEVERGKEEVASIMRLSEMEKQKQLDAMTRAQSYRREELDSQVRELERRELQDREDEMLERSKNQIQQRNYDDFLSRETAKLGVGRSQSDVFQSRPTSTFSRHSMKSQ
ncbi:hypothetical protein RvY_15044-2 [Ramazzottius varieornatus]|uniref:Trichoplein keratin filament-binding protein n=1 Tax=Ramazzottius varieornatus TaxID=947166 RepID=A0A1D1VX28_RAMVA|nr:hypothetical protein RvY_15044-2 [Ramazzottius varieornatus]